MAPFPGSARHPEDLIRSPCQAVLPGRLESDWRSPGMMLRQLRHVIQVSLFVALLERQLRTYRYPGSHRRDPPDRPRMDARSLGLRWVSCRILFNRRTCNQCRTEWEHSSTGTTPVSGWLTRFRQSRQTAVCPMMALAAVFRSAFRRSSSGEGSSLARARIDSHRYAQS